MQDMQVKPLNEFFTLYHCSAKMDLSGKKRIAPNPVVDQRFSIRMAITYTIWGDIYIYIIWGWVKTLVPSEPQNSW